MIDISPKTLGERLELALAESKLSQAQASAVTGVPQATISHLIRNKARTYKNSRALADGLKINHDWLVYGRGGILNHDTYYIPIIHDYFRLRLYLSEKFLEKRTHFIVTEQNYGECMFATVLDTSLLICSEKEESEYIYRNSELLSWTESNKLITNNHSQWIGIFLIHEKRSYNITPNFLIRE
ncbi:helix-turn-helix domain-containing protein [Serratia symbiotica]|uniref:Helix-turn-helix transcriptional regulator n=1 Tax=Serratia symbiotica TaxID=138074 RepID=A0A068Z7S1_9GAMM|nr:helix-turn-helix transcriptional regulator [Serratia symbiotica]QLH64541.1 helix-turn-helix transcriptional regulator [Serratia symbiotica]CDS57144.1 putative transcriptional regulatory protein [Serratia symbiotica]